jgi:hypothetical protein
MQYMLEIYPPYSLEGPLQFESSSPFPPIARGDLINTRMFEAHWAEVFRDKGSSLVRVVAVEHVIGKAGRDSLHMVMLYTEPAPDTAEERIKQ